MLVFRKIIDSDIASFYKYWNNSANKVNVIEIILKWKLFLIFSLSFICNNIFACLYEYCNCNVKIASLWTPPTYVVNNIVNIADFYYFKPVIN